MKKIIIALMLSIFLIGLISADLTDKVVYMDNDEKVQDMVFEVKSWWGWFEWLGIDQTVITGELKSHNSTSQKLEVASGKSVVMYYSFTNNNEELVNILGDVKFIDMNTGQEVYRDWRFVYKGLETYDKPIYTCEIKPDKNMTLTEVCTQTGTEKAQREAWLPYDSRNIPTGDIIIGIEAEVKVNDWIDGIWNVKGEDIEKHAEWTASLDNGLVAYYNLNELSGNVLDTTGNGSTGTTNATQGTTGKIGTAYTMDSRRAAFTSPKWNFTQYHSMNCWIKITSSLGTNNDFIFGGTNAYILYFNSGAMRFGKAGVDNADPANAALGIGGWQMISYVYNSTGIYYIINGTSVSAKAYGTSFTANPTYIIGTSNAVGGLAPYVLDECAFWSRTLTLDDLSYLWNSGAGITRDASVINISVLTPANGSVFNTQNINFSANVSDKGNLGIKNVSLMVNNVTIDTNTNGTQGVYNFTTNLATTGFHNWTVKAVSNSSITYIGSLSNFTIDTKPTIDIHSPETNRGYSNPVVTFNATSGLIVDDWVINFNSTNITITNQSGTSLLYNIAIAEGVYNLTIYANNSATGEWGVNNSIKNFKIDSISPTIVINSGEGLSTYGYTGYNHTVNFTATDTNLATCVFRYSGTNYTIPCNSSQQTKINFSLAPNTNNVFIYANDSAGNYANVTAVWSYSVFENVVNYSASVLEGETNQIIGNFTLNTTLTSVKLLYNNTEYSPSVASYGNNYLMTREVIAPTISADSNISFYFYFNGAITTRSYNQSVVDSGIDNCLTYTNVIMNYTFYDEDTLIKLLNTSNLSTNIDVRLGVDFTGTYYNQDSFNSSNNSLLVCSKSALIEGKQYRLDATIKTSASEYTTEYYFIENYTLNNSRSPYNISIYLLPVARSQEFLITFKDINYIPLEGAIIELSRQYLSLGDFIVVENARTDVDGRAIAHFVLNDEVYDIYVWKNGVLRAVFRNTKAFCTSVATGDCQIYLNEFGSTTLPNSYNTRLGISGVESYNDTTKTFGFSFTSNDGLSKIVYINITKYDNYLNESICTDTIVGTSGTGSCVIPSDYENNTVIANVYVNDELFSTSIFSVTISKSEYLSNSRFILAFILIFFMVLMAISSASMVLIFFGLSFIVASYLYLIDIGGFIGSLSAFVWIIISIGILIWKINGGDSR